MSAQDSERYPNVPQSYRGGMLPAEHSHAQPEPGRSATGWYVLVLLTAAAVASIWISVENWRPDGLADRAEEAIELRQHYEEISRYGNALHDQNEQMTEMQRLLGRRYRPPPPPPNDSALEQMILSRQATLKRLVDANTVRCRVNTNRAACQRAREAHEQDSNN